VLVIARCQSVSRALRAVADSLDVDEKLLVAGALIKERLELLDALYDRAGRDWPRPELASDLFASFPPRSNERRWQGWQLELECRLLELINKYRTT